MKTVLNLLQICVVLASIGCDPLQADPCPHCSDLREDCLVTRTHGGGSSGKWLDDETPKRGWTCSGAEDLGSGNMEECEMCEREQVRYIHSMFHGDAHPLSLRVGCICASHMEGETDSVEFFASTKAAAEARTRTLLNRAKRRSNFSGLQSWKVSKNGNPYLNKDGHLIVITSSRFGKFSAIFDRRGKLGSWHGTIDLAKTAAFDYLHPPHVN